MNVNINALIGQIVGLLNQIATWLISFGFFGLAVIFAASVLRPFGLLPSFMSPYAVDHTSLAYLAGAYYLIRK